MKTKLNFLFMACFALLSLSTNSTCWGTIVTFDEISNIGTGTFLTNGYQGLNWTNFLPINAILRTNSFGPSGYYYGMESASNVAYNAFGNPAEIDSQGANFNFLSAYLTGAWNSNLNIEVQGFSGTNLVYDETVVASATNATLFTFNYLDIDRLTFNSFGGQPVGFVGGGGEEFAMDNFDFEFIPEPSSLLLTGIAALLLWPILSRKRT